jgi:dissimilatory sulfite reductase (desulfoviridin) alpha/beta subunit
MQGAVRGAARELADSARESDFARLVADIEMARQAEDTFRTFREAGKMMGYHTLREIGDIVERHHDAYVKEASRLVQHMFVENVQGVDRTARRFSSSDLEASSP